MRFEFQQTCPYCGNDNIRFVKESAVKEYMITKCVSFVCHKTFLMKFGMLKPITNQIEELTDSIGYGIADFNRDNTLTNHQVKLLIIDIIENKYECTQCGNVNLTKEDNESCEIRMQRLKMFDEIIQAYNTRYDYNDEINKALE